MTYEDGVFIVDDPVEIVAVGDGVGELVDVTESEVDALLLPWVSWEGIDASDAVGVKIGESISVGIPLLLKAKGAADSVGDTIRVPEKEMTTCVSDEEFCDGVNVSEEIIDEEEALDPIFSDKVGEIDAEMMKDNDDKGVRDGVHVLVGLGVSVLLEVLEALDPIVRDAVGEPVADPTKDKDDDSVCNGVTALVKLGVPESLEVNEALDPIVNESVGELAIVTDTAEEPIADTMIDDDNKGVCDGVDVLVGLGVSILLDEDDGLDPMVTDAVGEPVTDRMKDDDDKGLCNGVCALVGISAILDEK